MWNYWQTRTRDTGIACPDCDDGRLEAHLSCLRTRLVCDRCQSAFSLDRICRDLDEETFGRLEEILGDRLSDRI